MGPRLFCFPLGPGLVRPRAEFEAEGVQAFAYVDELSLGLMQIAANTVSAVPFVRPELDEIGKATNPTKTVALPPKGHVPTVEYVALLAIVNARILLLGWDDGGGCPGRHWRG